MKKIIHLYDELTDHVIWFFIQLDNASLTASFLNDHRQ